MRIFKWKRLVPVILVGLCCGSAIRAFADDDGKDKAPDKSAATKIEAPAPLTERERLLLDRVEQLEKRVADLEVKGNPSAASGADAAAEQPASTTPVASTAEVAASWAQRRAQRQPVQISCRRTVSLQLRRNPQTKASWPQPKRQRARPSRSPTSPG